MKIIFNNLIPFKGYSAINLFGILFVRNEYKILFNLPANEIRKNRLINHESIHSKQMKELLWIPYYLWYIIEWIFRLFQYKFNSKQAYRNISFEREAYSNESNLDYLKSRKRYSFLKYLKI